MSYRNAKQQLEIELLHQAIKRSFVEGALPRIEVTISVE